MQRRGLCQLTWLSSRRRFNFVFFHFVVGRTGWEARHVCVSFVASTYILSRIMELNIKFNLIERALPPITCAAGGIRKTGRLMVHGLQGGLLVITRNVASCNKNDVIFSVNAECLDRFT